MSFSNSFAKKFSNSNLNKIESRTTLQEHPQHIISAPLNSTTEIILQQEKQGTEGAHGSEKIERRCSGAPYVVRPARPRSYLNFEK